MSAEIRRIRTRPERLRDDENALLSGILAPLMEDDSRRPEFRAALRKVQALIDRETASKNRRTFVLLNAEQNYYVLQSIRRDRRFKRRVVAAELWALCLDNMVWGTGEITLTRTELAERLGVFPQNVTEIMSGLQKINAIIIRREPVAGKKGRGSSRYFVNPQVATNLGGKARDDAQEEAGPILTLVEGTAHPAQVKPDAE